MYEITVYEVSRQITEIKDPMYEITVYKVQDKKSRHWPKETKSFKTFEEFVLWERSLDWKQFYHNGELLGSGKHADWYALKNFGEWTLRNRTFED